MVYRAVGTTTSVEEAVSHDGPAIQNGRYVSFNRNSDEPDLAFTSHPMAGTQDHYQITDELDTHVVLLSELERNPVEK
jgi:hypothetical protein